MQKQIEQALTSMEVADMKGKKNKITENVYGKMADKYWDRVSKLSEHEKSELTVTSLEVARMVNGKEHKNLMRDIRSYVAELAELKIEPGEFFMESTYIDANNQIRPCYDVTKKGCEFIAHKLTGIKGTEFTAKYINRFHDMEDVIQQGVPQKNSSDEKLRVMEMNARSRMAQTYLKLAQIDTLSTTYKNVLASKASEVLAGERIIPLPKIEQIKVYTAKDIGDMFGISANKVGRIANQNNLKTSEYGEYRRDKSKHSAHECDAWVYYEAAIPVFRTILGG